MELNPMTKLRRAAFPLVALLLSALTLAACGDTWRGFKEDTGDNLKATGNAVHNAGQKVQP
jgi:predicted small secreted protein